MVRLPNFSDLEKFYATTDATTPLLIQSSVKKITKIINSVTTTTQISDSVRTNSIKTDILLKQTF